MNPSPPPAQEISEDRGCARCGAKPRLVNVILDSAKDRTVRMFKCDCGEQTWA